MANLTPPVKGYVTVDGVSYEITVAQRSRTVWMAYGDFGSKKLIAEGSSADDALAKWKRQAESEDSPPSNKHDV
jgi:hypothetical protein